MSEIVEVQTFFDCLAGGVTSCAEVNQIIIGTCPCGEGCDACGYAGEIRVARPIRRLHPADEWTLKSFLAISVNGSFT